MKKILVAITAAICAAVAVPAGHAGDVPSPGHSEDDTLAFVAVIPPSLDTSRDSAARSFVVSGTAKGFRSATGQLMVALNCAVQAVGDAASTRLTECRLYAPGGIAVSANYSTGFLPGATAATAARFIIPAQSGLYLCAAGASTWLLAPTGTTYSPRSCSNLI